MRDIAPFLTMIVAGALTLPASDADWSAEKKHGPGVTDSEIKIGPTIAYSGPASSFGTTGHPISAYHRLINAASVPAISKSDLASNPGLHP